MTRAISSGTRAARALYGLFILSIPLETVFYFRDQADPDSGVSLSRVIGCLLIGVALAQPAACLRRLPAAFWLLAAYLGTFALSALWIPPSLDGRWRSQFFTMAQMAALFLVSVNLLEDPAFRGKMLRLYGCWVTLLALAMLLGYFGVRLEEESRASIATQDPNVTAMLFGLAALALAGDPALARPPRRLALLAPSTAAIGALIGAVLRTGSRGGLLALGAGFLALAIGGGSRRRGPRLAIAALVLGLTALLIRREFAQHTDSAARIERAWNSNDTAGREEIYGAAWAMFLERPWLGYGGANNRFELGTRLNYPNRDTHNVFLEMLTEVGVTGGAAFFGALLLAAIASWRGARRTGDARPFALLCAALAASTSINGAAEKIFWVVLACAASAARPGPVVAA